MYTDILFTETEQEIISMQVAQEEETISAAAMVTMTGQEITTAIRGDMKEAGTITATVTPAG